MIKVKYAPELELYDYGIDKTYSIDISKLGIDEKMSGFSDTLFKAIFQNENKLIYSALLLSYILKDYSLEEILNNLSLVKNELDKTVASKKSLRSDYVALLNGTKINIEVNNNSSVTTLHRNMEYAFRLYSHNVTVDNKIYDYRQSIQINLNNFAFKNNDKIIDIYTIRNDEGTSLSNKVIIVQIYVPNIRKKWYTSGIESLNEFERYVLTIMEKNIEDSKKLGKGHKIMEDYIKDAVIASNDEILLEAYDKEWALKDEGLRDGITQGIEQGITQGSLQKEAEIVCNMLKKNMDINLISEITGLSLDEINKIKNEN